MSKRILTTTLTKFPAFSNKLTAAVLLKAGVLEGYQPLNKNEDGKRETHNRWAIIQDRLDKTASSCIDLGCNTGFFANSIASHDIFTMGFDAEIKNVVVANALYQRPNLIFKHFTLDLHTANLLPQTDVFVFLSVFHHLVKYYGAEDAKCVLKSIAQKCQKQFFFETGQFDEKGTKFAHLLDFMPDVEDFSKTFFLDTCGFKKYEILGEFETFLTPTKRKLFVFER